MSILIKGMEMPKTMSILAVFPNGYVAVYDSNDTFIGKAKAIPVPDHGRLIDADALEKLLIKQKYACAGASAHGSISELHKSWGLHDAELMTEAAPTIISADELSGFPEQLADREEA